MGDRLLYSVIQMGVVVNGQIDRIHGIVDVVPNGWSLAKAVLSA